MRAIFISYRREDAEGEAGRLFDDLVDVYGENSVFMDVAAIEAGQDFRRRRPPDHRTTVRPRLRHPLFDS